MMIVLDPWFGLLPDKPSAPRRFTPIQIVDQAGQPLLPEAQEATVAESAWGRVSPVEISRYIDRLNRELEKAKYEAQLPGWYLLVMVVSVGYLILSALAGDPMAVWIFRGALALYLLGWVWLIFVVVRDHFRK